MQVVQARATFVTPETFDESLTTIVARSVLEAALKEDESAELWFELGTEDGEDVNRLSIDLSSTDIEQLLRLSSEDEIALTLDGEGGGEPVRRAGRRGSRLEGCDRDRRDERRAARSRHRAGCGSADHRTAATQQAKIQATAQVAPAATAQVSSLAARAQVSMQAKTQVAKTQVAKIRSRRSAASSFSGAARAVAARL